jgi:hypothetical protein
VFSNLGAVQFGERERGVLLQPVAKVGGELIAVQGGRFRLVFDPLGAAYDKATVFSQNGLMPGSQRDTAEARR